MRVINETSFPLSGDGTGGAGPEIHLPGADGADLRGIGMYAEDGIYPPREGGEGGAAAAG